ncbi:MAG: helix-turn-helix domain-containing protein [Spirochaetales bacterium]|nr:helix-turn-helix domain-containing protein [Spirochaetales bacterium]
MEPLLTIQEAADLTRLKVKTLYTYAEKEIIPHVRLGRRIFFREKQIDEWVTQCSVNPIQQELIK